MLERKGLMWENFVFPTLRFGNVENFHIGEKFPQSFWSKSLTENKGKTQLGVRKVQKFRLRQLNRHKNNIIWYLPYEKCRPKGDDFFWDEIFPHSFLTKIKTLVTMVNIEGETVTIGHETLSAETGVAGLVSETGFWILPFLGFCKNPRILCSFRKSKNP